ncbi:MAG TPA: dinitrogenase iron-molybdenum cofactor [Ruminococcaceae bacterium]|nr:dinitrogenase iron-molybdenum cofactor [Oscillospiraceae bacterium]
MKTLKIAVASDNGGKTVTGHFGHCEGFDVFTSEDGKITGGEFFPNPGHKPGFLPNYLNGMGVNVVISGGMGGGAADIFKEKGIKVITGAEGGAREAAQCYIAGTLKSTGGLCSGHSNGGD